MTTRWLAKEVARLEEPLKKLNRAGFGARMTFIDFEPDAFCAKKSSSGVKKFWAQMLADG